MPEDKNILIDFFDSRAFADNPEWSFCYCNCFYADHCEKRWKDRTAEENREATHRRVESGKMFGYIAVLEESVVGWCGAGPAMEIPDFAADEDPDNHRKGVVHCFLVDPRHRRRGIARMLLRFACSDLGSRKLTIIEGNPRPGAVTEADNHFGPVSLFLSEGFEFFRDDPDDGSVYVRKYLGE